MKSNLILLIVTFTCVGALSACSDEPSALELESTILACNAGQVTDREKCKQAEKAQADNLNKFMSQFIKK